jgi:hypothetical protein
MGAAALVGREFTCTVSTEVTVPFAGNCADWGLNEQATPDGGFKHTNVNWSPKPFNEFNVTFTSVELPAGTVADVFDSIKLASSIFSCALALWDVPDDDPVTMKV